MTRKQFLAEWKQKREAKLRELYSDDPHGPACLAMSLIGIEDEGLRLWRRHRTILKKSTVEEFATTFAEKLRPA